MDETPRVPSLVTLCIKKLVEVTQRYGLKKIASQNLSLLPSHALVEIIDDLVRKNALNDNVLIHCLGKSIDRLSLANCVNLRRSVLQTIGRICPDLRVLDLTGCKQAGNRIVHEVLLNARHLQVLTLNGCVKISDSAFTPEPFTDVLIGLLCLEELNIAKCSQVSMRCLRSCVLKSAPKLQSLNLSHCSSVDNADLQELLWFDLTALDISSTAISDEAFQTVRNLALRKLCIGNTALTDESCAIIARTCADLLRELDVQSCRISDRTLFNLNKYCPNLETLNLRGTNITTAGASLIPPSVNSLSVAMCVNLDLKTLKLPNASSLDLSWLKLSKEPQSLVNCQFNNLQVLRVYGMAVDAASLRNLCAAKDLVELGITIPNGDEEGDAFMNLGLELTKLTELVIEFEQASHVKALVLPRFRKLKSLTLKAPINDHQLKEILTSRKLEHLFLQAPNFSPRFFRNTFGREQQNKDQVNDDASTLDNSEELSSQHPMINADFPPSKPRPPRICPPTPPFGTSVSPRIGGGTSGMDIEAPLVPGISHMHGGGLNGTRLLRGGMTSEEDLFLGFHNHIPHKTTMSIHTTTTTTTTPPVVEKNYGLVVQRVGSNGDIATGDGPEEADGRTGKKGRCDKRSSQYTRRCDNGGVVVLEKLPSAMDYDSKCDASSSKKCDGGATDDETETTEADDFNSNNNHKSINSNHNTIKNDENDNFTTYNTYFPGDEAHDSFKNKCPVVPRNRVMFQLPAGLPSNLKRRVIKQQPPMHRKYRHANIADRHAHIAPTGKRKAGPEHPVAECFRTLLSFHLTGPGLDAMSDSDAYCLADSLPYVTCVDIEAPNLTKDTMRFFLKQCRFLRHVSLRMGECTHSWNADSGAVEQRRRKHRWARVGGTASASAPEDTGAESW